MENSAQTFDPRRLLIDWANQQDSWIRYLVGQIVVSQRPISDEEARDLFEQFLAEKGFHESLLPTVPQDLPYPAAGSAQSERLRLLSLSNVSGVNALSPGGKIDFNPGLTILYGENGTGKTGYARILKRISAVLYPEEILPNVHSPTPETPSATIDYQLGGVQESIQWQNEVGVSPFTRMSVFDSPTVNLRIDESLAYVFTPAEISLFSYVSSGIRAVQARGSQTHQTMTVANPFLRQFERGTAIYQEIETLGAATDLTTIEQLAVLPENADHEREQLARKVAALRSDAVHGLLTAHKEAVRTLEIVYKVAHRVETFEVDQYNEAIVALATLREAYRRVREETFAPGELPGPANDEWQRFITSAAEYLDHLGLTHYPQSGKQCIYCRQLLDAGARSIITRYATFLDDVLGHQISEQQKLVASMAAILSGLPFVDMNTGLKRQREDNPAFDDLDGSEEFVRNLQTSIEEVMDSKRVTSNNLQELTKRVRRQIVPLLATHKSEVASLKKQLADRETALHTANTSLRALTAAINLNHRLPEIEAFVKNAKRAARLEQALKPLSQILRSLTGLSKLASEDLVNSDFQARFEEECRALQTPTVRLEFIGRKGKAQRRKSLAPDHRLSQILSEGQQKVLALADFVAEARMGGSSAPIVFDDPVNSLDHRRIKQVAARITALVSTCQVVVFTHDIWLATELLGHFAKRTEECIYYTVSDDQTTGAIGRIDLGTGPRWDTVGKLMEEVNEHLQDAADVTGTTQTALVEAAYGKMRSWCEVVVERVIFGDVSRRYRANIMMGGLNSVYPERMAPAIEVIRCLFEKACRYMPDHSQPLPTLSTRPSLGEARKDWKTALDAIAAYKNPKS